MDRTFGDWLATAVVLRIEDCYAAAIVVENRALGISRRHQLPEGWTHAADALAEADAVLQRLKGIGDRGGLRRS